MIFLSDFLRADIVDVHQKVVGAVRDLIVRVEDPYPVVVALALRSRRGRLPELIDWGAVPAKAS